MGVSYGVHREIGLYHCEVRGHSWVLLHNLSNTPIRAKCEARAKNRDHSNNRVTGMDDDVTLL